MTRHINAEAAQLLNQAPYFGAVGGNLVCDLSAADNNRGVLHQQAHDPTETEIGGLWLVRRERFRPQRTFIVAFAFANCSGLADAVIMRESPPNNNVATAQFR